MKNQEKTLFIKANAKLNLSLDIVGTKENGYHLMKMVMAEIDLCDDIYITANLTAELSQVFLECRSEDVTIEELPSEENIAVKAAMAFLNSQNINARVDIKLIKRIPSQAGLGGGSADGAAVLKGLNQLLDTGLSNAELVEIGKGISADIPFCIVGGVALVEGIGEYVAPIKTEVDGFFVVIKPDCSVSTKEAFESFDCTKTKARPNTDALISALEADDIIKASAYFLNVFENETTPEQVKKCKALLKECGGMAPTMTGSGSAVFALFESKSNAQKALEKCRADGTEAYICKLIKQN